MDSTFGCFRISILAYSIGCKCTLYCARFVNHAITKGSFCGCYLPGNINIRGRNSVRVYLRSSEFVGYVPRGNNELSALYLAPAYNSFLGDYFALGADVALCVNGKSVVDVEGAARNGKADAYRARNSCAPPTIL